ncbi:hypothetical protein ACH5RR_000895, partial [Cinchona calisaya]
KKFRWPPRHNAAVRENFEKRGAGRLAQMLQKVRKDGRKPSWMGDSAWVDLNKYWQSQEFKQKSDQNKKNRDSSAGASLHTGGSIPHRVHFKKMKAEKGENLPFSDFYFRTHKKKEGDWVHPRAQAAYENFEKKKAEISSQSTVENDNMSSDGSQHSQHLPSDLDIWYDAVGGKKKGRVSGLGSLGRTMKGYSSRPSHPYDLPEDVDERIRSTVHSLSAELQAQLERERLEKEEMKKQQASLQAQLSETRNQLHTLMERLGVLPGSSRHRRSRPLDADDEDGSSED